MICSLDEDSDWDSLFDEPLDEREHDMVIRPVKSKYRQLSAIKNITDGFIVSSNSRVVVLPSSHDTEGPAPMSKRLLGCGSLWSQTSDTSRQQTFHDECSIL